MAGDQGSINPISRDYGSSRSQMMDLWQDSIDRTLEKFYAAQEVSHEGDHPDADLEQALRKKTEGCQTCRERQYQDGSSDSAVSFQGATKLGSNVEGAVRSHEREHVIRENAKAKMDGGKIVQSSVAITHAVCPECGTRYVSGGLTTTKVAHGGKEKSSGGQGFVRPGGLDVKG